MIKVYTLFFLFCFSTLITSAQFNTGQKVIGGNVGFGVNNNKNYYTYGGSSKQTNINVNPTLGWFTKPNLVCGIGINYNYSIQKNNSNNSDSGKTYSHSFGVNLFSQRFFTLAHNFYFTVNTGGALAYNFGKSALKNNYYSNGSGYSINISIAPGISYRVTERLLFDAYLANLLNVYYSHNQNTNPNLPSTDNKVSQSFFGVSSSLSNTSIGNVGLGFRWLLKKHQS